MHLSRE